jgi:hypothetical protein
MSDDSRIEDASKFLWPPPSVLDSLLTYAASGTSVGGDTAHLLRSPRRSGWWWWVSTATCGTPCTWALQQGGLGCGLYSGTPTPVAIAAVAAVEVPAITHSILA